MKSLEEFIGYVDIVRDGIAYVTLESKLNGDILQGEIEIEKLISKGIERTFTCKVIQLDNGNISIELNYREPKKVTKEEIEEIEKELNLMLGDDEEDES